jgi:hypothetical protein
MKAPRRRVEKGGLGVFIINMRLGVEARTRDQAYGQTPTKVL